MKTFENEPSRTRGQIPQLFLAGIDMPVGQVILVSQWYRSLSREYHPDLGGSHEAMKAVNRGRELLLQLMEDAAA
jgi:hypothetical protein